MIYIQAHFNLTRILMLAIGLWPYKQTKLVQLQLILVSSILTSFVVFQFTTFLTTECSPNLVIKIITCSLFVVSPMIMHNSFWLNIHTVKYSFEQLQDICNELNDDGEIAIIKRYGNDTKRYTLIFFVCAMCCVVFVGFLSIWPQILSTILPINVSQTQRIMYVMTEYFVDQERYFYLILLHVNTATCIGMTVRVATGTMLVGCFIHACGLFSIASYRIKQAMTINMMKNAHQEKQILIYRKIVGAVNMHCKALDFIELLMSAFEGLLFLLIVIDVIIVSLSLYGISSCRDNISDFVLYVACISTTFVNIFIANYLAQDVTDHNNDIFVTVYNFQWYMASLRVQKMVLFMLRRGTKTFYLIVGGLFVGSLQNSATLISASISYFTVLYSMQK
ncbi:hypothetical protein DMN91_005724 [Ooceraea biroi]|uniref:Odorant receptor n=1 Tax=Ooceraea biroi TaxID=2015173 RepID=A0A026VWJ0_OOCBI|nr:uncharacterized protein LOC105285846 isoform X1 [Ooceraea biroi]EZA48143.1 hypothetical protein X777_14325 [Ooceraea biroi]RLU21351.1 hypothetical protein DMN91_005724 [Ooceraea biroi]